MSTIALDSERDASKLHRAPFKLRHGLSGHALFALPRLVALAKSMPRDRIEYNSGRVAIGQDPEATPQIDLPAEEVIRRIEDCNAWMVIKNVETDPAYREVLCGFLDEAMRTAGLGDARHDDLQGFVFVSSGGSTTPFHVDAEENILVQIAGDKWVHVFDNADRTLVSEEAMEISPSKHRNQRYDARFEERAQVFALAEGEAVHIPYMWPHWVRTGSRHSISMAMTWKTPQVRRLNKVRLMNGTLRRFGLAQRPPGAVPVMDGAKVLAHDAVRLTVDPLRRSEPVRRALRGLIYGRSANYYLKAEKARRG